MWLGGMIDSIDLFMIYYLPTMFSEGWSHVHLTPNSLPHPRWDKNTLQPPPGREGTWDQRYPTPRKDMGPGIPSLLPQELRLVQAGCTHATGISILFNVRTLCISNVLFVCLTICANTLCHVLSYLL